MSYDDGWVSDAEFTAFMRQQPGFADVERGLAERFGFDSPSEVPITMSGSMYGFLKAAADGEMSIDEVTEAMSDPDAALEGIKKLMQRRGIDFSDLEERPAAEEGPMGMKVPKIPDGWVDVTEDWRNFMLEGGEPAMAYAVREVHYNPDSVDTDDQMQMAGFAIESWVNEDEISPKLRRKMGIALVGAIDKWRKANGIED